MPLEETQLSAGSWYHQDIKRNSVPISFLYTALCGLPRSVTVQDRGAGSLDATFPTVVLKQHNALSCPYLFAVRHETFSKLIATHCEVNKKKRKRERKRKKDEAESGKKKESKEKGRIKQVENRQLSAVNRTRF